MKKWEKLCWDSLPRKGKYIDWKNTVGMTLKGVYNKLNFEILIINYNIVDRVLTVKYLDKETYDISANGFIRCQLGEYLFNRSKHKRKVGDIFITNTGEQLEITECFEKYNYKTQLYRSKWYKYRCLNCTYEGEIIEGNLTIGQGCSCCSNSKVIVEGINDIPTTAPWMVKYFQGGYDEAKLYVKTTHKKIKPICPDCNRIKNKEMGIYNIYRNRSIGCSCGDGISYPEKIMYSVLDQLNIYFFTQLNKTILDWCEGFKYDFYIPSPSSIVETHGKQHYEEISRKSKTTLIQIQKNDKNKKDLALYNDVDNYIIINCRYSELNFIKNNILNSELSSMFDLTIINWNKCEEFATNNLAKEICKFKNNNEILSANKISKIFKIGTTTVTSYLNKGTKFGWCNYDGKEEMKRSAFKVGKLNSKRVEIFKDGKSIGIFKSNNDLERQSEELFGVKLLNSAISAVCRGKRQSHKGYFFKYVEEVVTNV